MRKNSVLALAFLLAAAPAVAAPYSSGDAGQSYSALFSGLTLQLSDRAVVTFNPDSSFLDVGILPVIGFTQNGTTVTPAGFGGSGWGAYISYRGTGIQTGPSASYNSLAYEIDVFRGTPTYTFGAKDVVASGVTDVTPVASGSLISGSLAFEYNSGSPPTILGKAVTSIDQLAGTGTALEVDFIHPASDYAFTSSTRLQIFGGNQSSAKLVPSPSGVITRSASADALATDAVDVPEPASLALLSVGLLAVAARRRRA